MPAPCHTWERGSRRWWTAWATRWDGSYIKVIPIIILIPNLIIIEKVRLIRQPKRAGLMRTRMVGVMESKSQVYKYIV